MFFVKERDMPSKSKLSSLFDHITRRKRWHVIADLILQNGFYTFIEVGVEYGQTMNHIITSLHKRVKFGRCIAIDNYTAYDHCTQEMQDERYKIAKNRLYGKCCLWKYTSQYAASQIEDNSVDIIFIDANHNYNNVKKDIELWYPKVRKGGILIGHDYTLRCMGVVKAVTEKFDSIHTSDDNTWWCRK